MVDRPAEEHAGAGAQLLRCAQSPAFLHGINPVDQRDPVEVDEVYVAERRQHLPAQQAQHFAALHDVACFEAFLVSVERRREPGPLTAFFLTADGGGIAALGDLAGLDPGGVAGILKRHARHVADSHPFRVHCASCARWAKSVPVDLRARAKNTDHQAGLLGVPERPPLAIRGTGRGGDRRFGQDNALSFHGLASSCNHRVLSG